MNRAAVIIIKIVGWVLGISTLVMSFIAFALYSAAVGFFLLILAVVIFCVFRRIATRLDKRKPARWFNPFNGRYMDEQ